ncbi:SSI family serine proteinase inhibitor [Streptomyces sp. NPDC018019]|uniref:SSI family serine proteinase inhibitor n=1 Tax=Streptomyces sp. NPDC018019 TaxID=3365030 RepID=UPI00379ABA77
MRARPVRTALLAVAALGLLPLAAAPAAAHDAQPETGGRQHIAIHEGTDPSGPVLAAAYLRCFPVGGSHPDPAGACLKLAIADGDYARVAREPRACPKIYQPVTVVAHGTWRGKTTFYKKTYPNQCIANAESGDIFNLTPWNS